MSDVIGFRRIRGRIIPIKRKAERKLDAIPTDRKVGTIAVTVASFAATKGRFSKAPRFLVAGIMGARHDAMKKNAQDTYKQITWQRVSDYVI